MKYNIFSALLFILIATGFIYIKLNHLDNYTFSHKAENFKGVLDTTEIDEIRLAAKALLKHDEYYVESYNNLLQNSINVFISLCFLAAFLSVLAILSAIKSGKQKNKSSKQATPGADAP